MATQPLGPVVVGVDGSESSMLALDLAAEEAAARATSLTVLHVHDGLPDTFAAASRIVAGAADRAGAEHPMVSVRGVVGVGDPAEVLGRHAGEACLMVLGSHGGHRGPRRTDGVTRRVLGHAAVPVLIHRSFDTPIAESPRPVVVGIADPSAADALLAFAFEEAALRGTTLVAVHVRALGHGHVGPTAEAELAAAVGLWADKYPEVSVRCVLRHGIDVVVAFAAVSHTAQLVVVGAQRDDRLTVRTGEAIAHRAGCTVAVVPLG
jgi:nucleotide-binding universal stress UspA family protein